MRIYPESPIVGVGAVILDGDRVLLVKRAHEPLKGEWSLPGGAVDVGETLETAVAREILEETCLEIEVGPIVEVLNRIRRDPNGRVEYHYVLVDYACRRTGGSLACASDAEDVRWVPIDQLGAFDVGEAAIAVIKKAASLAWPPREVDRHAQ